jgi:hypothetical protein
MRLFPKLERDPRTDPQRTWPVPNGFPPRRTDEAPPLSEKHARYAAGHSLYLEGILHGRSPWVIRNNDAVLVLLSEAISSTFGMLALWAILALVIWGWHEGKPAPPAPYDVPYLGTTLAALLIIFSILIIIYYINYGRYGRLQRWLRYQWKSFEFFMLCEALMKYIGFIKLVFAVSLTVTIAAVCYRYV